MKQGLSRFTFFLNQINELLIKARGQKNPGMWLYKNDARTPFFMLEALAKVYADMHNPKKFGNLKEHFKLIEDALGKIDYYDSLYSSFAANKLIPANCTRFIKTRINQSAAQLNEVLADKDWLSNDNKRIKKINKKLTGADWMKSEKEAKAITAFYKSSVENICSFVMKTNYSFDNVEEDVHELRRRLRWLSIYPQAFQGAIQYAPDTKPVAHLKKYMTKEITGSSYNIFPPIGNNTSIILINKNYFLALSWIISQLGKLKDEGLLITGLSESLGNAVDSNKDLLIKAESLPGSKQRNMQAILYDAEAVTKVFFKEKNLQHLIS